MSCRGIPCPRSAVSTDNVDRFKLWCPFDRLPLSTLDIVFLEELAREIGSDVAAAVGSAEDNTENRQDTEVH